MKCLALVLLVGWCGTAASQDLVGRYQAASEAGAFTLTLQEVRKGMITGILAGEGGELALEGRMVGSKCEGTMSDGFESFTFGIAKEGEGLRLTIYDAEDPSAGQTLLFSPDNPVSATKKASSDSRVLINGAELSKDQMTELRSAYATDPLPGNYWYDARSGLYGAVGFPAYGFMLPDHSFGTLDRKASKGDTGVFINGRELPLSEFTVWSYIVGSWIQPGAYWLDHQGNAGHEGNPVPVINLYAAARQNSYSGKGSGGDNFWSTRFSAGNYNDDNTQGYVSVPGYGPIGYGF